MSIVCATRFTEESSFAVTVAAELARKSAEPVWLIHVLPAGLGVFQDGLDAGATAALARQAEAFAHAGVNVHTSILHGRLDQAVGRFCREKSATLLVVGDTARQVHPIRASTLDQLATEIPIPLLVVRDPKPFLAWVAGTAPLKVVLAMDHTSSSAVARDWIARLAKFGEIDLVATQVWWPLEEYERRKLPIPGPDEAHSALAETMNTETLAGLRGLPRNVKHRVHLEIGTGKVGEQLLELANEEHVDVFVVGSHRRRALGRLWSVSHHILSLAPMSVACIPATFPLPDLTTLAPFATALAATDLTEAGNHALSCALGVVGVGTVHVLHVAREPFSEEQEGVLLRKLAGIVPPDSERSGARVLVQLRQGDVATEIVKAGQTLRADVLCLGMKSGSMGRQGVVQRVLRESRQPVLLAPAVPE